MTIYRDLALMAARDQRKTGDTSHPWAVRHPDRYPGYWVKRLQGKVLRRLRYQRMCRRRGLVAPNRAMILQRPEPGWRNKPDADGYTPRFLNMMSEHAPTARDFL